MGGASRRIFPLIHAYDVECTLAAICGTITDHRDGKVLSGSTEPKTTGVASGAETKLGFSVYAHAKLRCQIRHDKFNPRRGWKGIQRSTAPLLKGTGPKEPVFLLCTPAQLHAEVVNFAKNLSRGGEILRVDFGAPKTGTLRWIHDVGIAQLASGLGNEFQRVPF